MGAAESSPQSKEVPFVLGEEFSRKSDVYKLWSRVQPCTRNNAKGTLFVKDLETGAEARQYFENGIKSLRQLRHPCILQYVDSQLLPNEARLFTERVQVLDLCIDTQSSIEIRAGLRSILDALIFLHTTASISHNAVCPSSIFVCPDGSWRLGGFEFARKYGGEKKDDHLLLSQFFKTVKPKPFSPPEDQTAMRSDNPPWARDAFGLGRLVEYAVRWMEKEEGVEEEVLASLRLSIDSLCASSASERMRLEESRGMEAFKNPLSEVEHFVRRIQTKTEEEKGEFFDCLPSLLSSLPSLVIGRRLSRPLLSRYVILEQRSHDHLLPRLLTPVIPSDSSSSLPSPLSSSSGLLPLGLFRESVLPECSHVLRVRDIHVRLAILTHFHRFAPFYSRDQLGSGVLAEVLVGLDDADDRIVAETLRALSILVPILGADVVLGKAKLSESTTPSIGRRITHRERARIFVDGTPKASTPLSSALPSTVCSPFPSRAVSPSREVEKRLNLEEEEEGRNTMMTKKESKAYKTPTVLREASVEEWNEDDEGWNDGWGVEKRDEDEEIKDQKKEEEEERVVTVMKSTVERKESGMRREEKKDGEIGSEFALKVTVRSEIDDLFAEMQPEIKSSGSILTQLEEMAAKSTRSTVSPTSTVDDEKKEKGETTTRLTFVANDEADSWGNEGEWGLDED